MMSAASRIRSWAVMLGAGALLATANGVSAELYRCVGPDGRTVYTDSQATCPGAREHRPAAGIQNYRTDATTRPPAGRRPGRAAAAAVAPSPATGGEAAWRQKQSQARDELQAIEQRIARVSRFVKHCNRGGSVYRTHENGLRSGVSCDWLRDEVPELEQRRDELQAYLDHGLREECRRAGCLPGWLR